MPNITKSFVSWMESEGYGTFGTDLFIGGTPLNSPDVCWWILASGGSPLTKLDTGEKVKTYRLNVFYRSDSAEDLYDTLQAFEEDVNSSACIDLDSYETVELEALTFPTDQDLESEDRVVGLVEVTITTYYNSTALA